MPSQRTARRVNPRFIVRALIVCLAVLALGLTGLSLLPPSILANLVQALQDARPADPTPPPPAIVAPRGALPPGQVGVTEQAQYQGGSFYAVGAGFLAGFHPIGRIVGRARAALEFPRVADYRR